MRSTRAVSIDCNLYDKQRTGSQAATFTETGPALQQTTEGHWVACHLRG